MTCAEWPCIMQDLQTAFEEEKAPFYDKGEQKLNFSRINFKRISIEDLGDELEVSTRRNKHAIIASCSEDHFKDAAAAMKLHNSSTPAGCGKVRRAWATAEDVYGGRNHPPKACGYAPQDVMSLKAAQAEPESLSKAMRLQLEMNSIIQLSLKSEISNVLLYNAQKQKMVQKMVGHSKKVTAVKLHGDKEVIVSASQDATAKVWTCSSPTDWSSQYNCLHTIRKHRLDVTDLSIHPLGDYLLTASLDKSWAIHDFATGRCVRHMKDLESAFPCMSFHPDGLIVAGGTEDKSVIVWDVKNDQATVATLLGHESAVQTLSFSGNGYYLASGSRDGVVKLWDLRKPVNLQTIQARRGRRVPGSRPEPS
ncbi:unnamed protein product [Durusdinium trenchii]|uniref:Pre-mRNA-processing factor 19 n=1 Tax=Durusdinium trenchii TaxID=1381693 RepID=A0ABP0LC80_9DINO